MCRAVIGTSADGFHLLDAQGRILEVNDRYVKRSGYTRDELLAMHVTDLDALERPAETAARIAKVIRDGSDIFETLHRAKDGTVWPVEINVSYWSFDGGRFICFLRDISERKAAERQVRDSEERFRSIFDNIGIGIALIGRDMSILSLNPQMQKWFPHIDGNARHVCYQSFNTPPRERPCSYCPTVLTLEDGRVHTAVTDTPTPEGVRHYQIVASPLHAVDGSVFAAIEMVEDITERTMSDNKLTHSRHLMSYVISHAKSAIAVHDKDMKYVYVSDQYLRQYGVREKDLIGRHHYDVFPDLPQKWRDVHQRVLAGAVESKDEDPYVREDGSVDWTRWECRPWHEADGSIGGLIVYTEVITERKRREEALRASEQRFRTMADHAPVGIFQTDARGDCVYVNAFWCSLTGLTPEQAMGQGWARAIHPEDAKIVFKEWSEGDRSRRETSTEYRYVTPSGAVNWVMGTAAALTSDDGAVTGYIGSVVDITGRKRSEELLSLTRFSIDRAPLFVSWISPEGIVMDVNETAEHALGLSREQIVGHPMWVRDRTYSPERWSAHWSEIKRKGFVRSESRLTTSDGGHIDIELTTNYLQFAGREYAVNITFDVTERKKADEKLRQSEQFVRNILDTVDEGFLVIDRDYQIQTANTAYCSQLSRHCDEVIGRRCHEVSHGSTTPCYEAGEECAVRAVFATGAPHTALHRHPGPDGQLLYVETKAYPVKDAAGAVVSAIETITNITEKHLLEEERLKTQKLESIGTLAGGIAHDFNNLLQGIFGYISMAKLTFNQPDKSLAMLEQAEKALHQSVNLTTQLLTFSKGGKPVKRRVSLPAVIESAVKFALSGSRSGHRIVSAPELWQVEADEGQLGQVIQNIVLNADQAMPLGGSVVIEARNLAAADERQPPSLTKRDYVVISIRDTGIGISSEYVAKIFDPYFTTKEKGSGLGLATSYSIVRNHDGLIEVRSEIGKGCEFLIYLPAIAAVAEEPRKEAVCAGTRAGRILVMDDEDVVRAIAGELLAALGHTVVSADKGETAIEAYRQARAAGRPFDCVILDLTIRGGMGGEETVTRLLELDPDVKAVVSSGYSDDATMANFLQQGFRAVLKKPYNIQELKRTLDSLLGG